ncbi:inorganic phosphate transporter [Blattabacterium cuenoti]|uniref:inorganic phosphate transporter n=1 Tax=Blattabacterium cuenoti TaxID=1653831 RepID=UPI00163BA74F|nr:inorganic phosphate transporter [Blattabacterium cuenoti]
MELSYPLIIIILFILSIFDLIIGLINDAVNFLNSSIGSKVASRNTIMIFASIGIILGTFLSSGMMEIARKGVFDPSHFYFSDIIFIFLSVMISDIILLDIFNTLGLPTSTTVSMVFCLLGGSFSIATIKILFNNEPFYYITKYIKTEKALDIGIGIFLSIIISFLSGTFIHYFIRSIFSFNYKNKLKYIGVIWSSISLSSMTYFLIIKGLHSAIIENVDTNNTIIMNELSSYINNLINWIHHNFFIFIIYLIFTWIIIAKIFVSLGYNILRFVVLYGTFSLAMAFSGNDLVNFIGIPIAGIQSYNIWIKKGHPSAEIFNMRDLSKNNVQVPSSILIVSSIIMILTLWFSKKTRNITNTEINLSRQNEGPEIFLSNSLSRWIVRLFLFLGKKIKNFFPKKMLLKIEKNFKKNDIQKDNHVAFDLVRASSNLTISSILISIATIQKLPLSTTFVTFMVAMGTSLADRAWDRESAVYRVSGVLSVIRGWLLTGLIAFTMAGIVSLFLYFFKIWAILFLFCIIGIIIYKNYKVFSKIQIKKFEEDKLLLEISEINTLNILNKINNILKPKILSIKYIYTNSLYGIYHGDIKKIKNSRNHFLELRKNFIGLDNLLIKILKKTNETNPIFGVFYFHIYNTIKEITDYLDIISNSILFHIMNSHKPLKNEQKKSISKLECYMNHYFDIIKKIIDDNNYKCLIYSSKIIHSNIIKNVKIQMNQQLIGIIQYKYGKKNTFLILRILSESRKISERMKNMIILYHNMVSKLSLNKDNSNIKKP